MKWDDLTKVRHKKSGVIYGFVVITNEDCDNPSFVPTAVYRSKEGKNYSRPLSEFKDKFEMVERYNRIVNDWHDASGAQCKITVSDYRHLPHPFFGDKVEMLTSIKPIKTNVRVVLDYIVDNFAQIAPRREDHCNRSDFRLSVKHLQNMIFGYYCAAIPMAKIVETRMAEVILDVLRSPESKLLNKDRVIMPEDVLLGFSAVMVTKFLDVQQLGAEVLNNVNMGKYDLSHVLAAGLLPNVKESD